MGPGLARYDRDEIAISSKVGYMLKERQEGDDYVELFVDAPKLTSYFDYSRDAVLRSIACSALAGGGAAVSVRASCGGDGDFRGAVGGGN